MSKRDYKEMRLLSAEDLRVLCIRKSWCTKISNEVYAEFLASVEDRIITTDMIVELAQSIIDYSGLSSCDEVFEAICFELFETCHTYIYWKD